MLHNSIWRIRLVGFTLRGMPRVIFIGIIVAGSIRGSWGNHQQAQAAGASTLTVAISAEPDTLDPQVTGAAVTGQIDAYIGDGLVALKAPAPGVQAEFLDAVKLFGAVGLKRFRRF